MSETNYIRCRGGESARISIFVIRMAQEIESVQLVIFHTADSRLNSPKSGNYFSNDNFSFLWVIWKCLMKQKYFFITNFLHWTIRVFMNLLTSGMRMSREGGPDDSSGWPGAGQAFPGGATSQPPPRSYWVSSPCSHSAGFCQLGEPQAELLGSWVATVAQKAGTEANFTCCKSKKTWVYEGIIGFC